MIAIFAHTGTPTLRRFFPRILLAVLLMVVMPKHVGAQSEGPVAGMFLDPDVMLFIKNNPGLKPSKMPPTPDLLNESARIAMTNAIQILALELCTERWNDFPGYLEEAQRRAELLRRLYIQFLGVPAGKMAEFNEKALQAVTNTQTTDMLLADLNELYVACEQSLMQMSGGLNFAQ